MTHKIILALMIASAATPGTNDVVRENRISRTATIRLDAGIEKVFPLFGPIREKDWAFGWDPQVIYGNAEVEMHMIFRTPSAFNDESHYTWVITTYDPAAHVIEYTVSSVERIWFITVRCKAAADETLATVTYTYTGFTEKAHERNVGALQKMFAADLKDWEEAINYYLSTGNQLKP